MGAACYTVFDSPIGRCGIAWRGACVVAFALPGSGDRATIGALKRRWPDAGPALPPEPVGAAIDAVRRLFVGDPEDLSTIQLDLEGVPAFERRVYALLREVRPGETITYGALAEKAGTPGAARAVGAAMSRNPIPVIIPCHRVLAGSGRSGGFSASGGVTTKFRLLQIEQARRGSESLLFDQLPLAIRAPS